MIINICSKQSGLRLYSSRPNFNYFFREADVPIEVQESHAKKILRNPDFYIFKGKVPKKTKKVAEDGWKQELEEIKGIGKKTAKDIIKIYPNKEILIEAIKKGDALPIQDNYEEILKENFR